jgi:hypothetical protein
MNLASKPSPKWAREYSESGSQHDDSSNNLAGP